MTIYWQSVGDFFAMGGYGFYVWMSFGVTALAIVIESVLLKRKRDRAREVARIEGM